jgi:pimeloyl-ACP methyl ester carboxylesterase
MSLVETETLLIDAEIAGPPVLLLHGWPDAPRGWRPVAAALRAAGWRTVIPCLRGSGGTSFRSADTPRDAQAAALAQDAIDLLDALGIAAAPVVGHDRGARAAYTIAALFPDRVTAIAALALPYQPGGEFTVPAFRQARAFWYPWFMCLDAGAAAEAADPAGFARLQWETWSPPGWYDDAEFAATAASFRNPDWVAVTLNNYRARFLPGDFPHREAPEQVAAALMAHLGAAAG